MIFKFLLQNDSMTSLLTHTVAHFIRSSFRPKTNNQTLKKFLSLAVSWVKVVKFAKFWLSNIWVVSELISLGVQLFQIDWLFWSAIFCQKMPKRPHEIKNSIENKADKTELQVKWAETQLTSKSIFYDKNYPNLSKFFHWRISF